MKKLLPLLSLFVAFAQPASAADISSLQAVAQAEFKLLSEDLGSALSYKPLAPAEPLGITGFDLGLEVTSTDISRSSTALSKASGNADKIDNLIVPKLHFSKGLPLGIDVAFVYSAIPTTNIKLVGGELRYAILEGGTAMPAIAIRGAMTKLTGVEQLALDTRSVDLSISKGILMFTPYIGAGQVWVTSTPNGTAATVLTSESFTQNKVFYGLNLNFGLLNMALEGDKTGEASSTSFKLGFRW